jgi:hypothetical protein
MMVTQYEILIRPTVNAAPSCSHLPLLLLPLLLPLLLLLLLLHRGPP